MCAMMPFLDDEDSCPDAAGALARCGTSRALAMLRRRLTARDYELSATLFQGLYDEWLTSSAGQTLLRDVVQGGNAAAKRMAEELLSKE